MVMLYYKTKNHNLENLKMGCLMNDKPSFDISNEFECSKFNIHFEKVFSDILQSYSSNKINIVPKKGWVSTYTKGMCNELHTHLDNSFTSKGNHVLIQVIESGDIPEQLLLLDEFGNKQYVSMTTGDVIVFHVSTVHGLETTLEKLKVLVLAITI